ncbi:hypothetical protein QTI51_09595 [Variovorax sp. J22G73]|uniref:hypothetical protein n=1 Tax=unclassified Variovorax TaxID=663243 RepID=UPI002575D144|nr:MULTISPECIES: hypothetical protein [unclassified Variovorax]MDM0006447.1 hypothetical protein [Variovorax sp. J22R203]MDM0097530.1 hypothetical protein [Variovorax sp. J22G73]
MDQQQLAASTAVPLSNSVSAQELPAAPMLTAPPSATYNVHSLTDPAAAHIHDPDALDVAKATWTTQTILGQGVLSAAVHADADPHEPLYDPAFNPYAYAQKAGYEDLSTELANGWFRDAQTQQQFDRLAQIARWNKDARTTVEAGEGGSFALNMVASMMDITLLASGGAALNSLKAGSLLARVGKGAAIGLADSAAQEAVLRSSDVTRTNEESFMNIGSSIALGATVGGIFKSVHPDSPLNPGNPNNPLKPENLDKVALNEHLPGQLPEEGTRVTNQNDSIGAARVDPDRPRVTDEDLKIAKRRGITGWLADKMSWVGSTPLARLQNYSGPGSAAMFRLYDTGGVMSEAMAHGIGQGVEAETLRTIAQQQIAHAQGSVKSAFDETNKALGASGLGNAAATAGRVLTLGAVDRAQVTQKTFFGAMADRLAGLKTKDSGATDRILASLQSQGHTPEQAQTILAGVDKAVAHQTKFYNDFWDRAVKMGAADPRLSVDGEYGGPTLFNKKAIDRNPMAFQSVVLQQIHNRPMDEWLIERGHIEDPNAPPPVKVDGRPAPEPKPKSWKEITEGKDTAKRLEILREWTGSQELDRQIALEHAHAGALKDQADAMDRAKDVLSDFKAFNKDLKKLNAKALKAEGAAIESGIHVRNLASTTRAAEAAEAKVNAILARHPDPVGLADDVKASMEANGHRLDAHGARARQTEANLGDAKDVVDFLRGEKNAMEAPHGPTETGQALPETSPLGSSRSTLNQELREAYADLKKARAEHEQAMADFNATANEMRNSADWKAAVEKDAAALAKHDPEGKLAPGLRDRLTGDQDRLEVLKAHLDEVRVARARAISLARMLRKEVTAAKREVDGASWEVRKKAWALSKDAKRSPAAQYAEKLTNHLRGDDRAPGGMLMDNQPTSGRLKERQFDWTPDNYRALMDGQFVETDPIHMLDRYGSDMGGTLALHQAFDGRAKGDVMAEVGRHYDELIGAAKSDKERARLAATRRANLEDIEGGYRRIAGHQDAKDDNGVVWAAEKLKHVSLLRYQGGFILGALGDLATAGFAAPGSVLRSLSLKGARDFTEILKMAKAGHEGAQELEWIMGSMEHAAHMQFSERALGNGSGRDTLGFGDGLTRTLTGNIDRALTGASDAINKVTLLKGYSDMVRRTAGFVQLNNLRKWVGEYAGLAVGRKADLAKIGIGEWEAKQLARLFDKHGETSERGLFIPNASKWLQEPHGSEMADVLQAALVKTQKRASYTSGFGNAPLLMDRWYGKMFLQFQSYAFQFGNNFIRAGLQHGAVTGDHMKFAQAMGIAMAAGLMTTVIQSYKKDGPDGVKKLSDNKAAWGYQIVQRSGLLGWTGSYADAGVKVLNPMLQQTTGISIDNGSGKFSQNSALANAAGPWFGQLQDVSDMVGASARGDKDALRRKARVLVPLSQQTRLLTWALGGNPNQ